MYHHILITEEKIPKQNLEQKSPFNTHPHVRVINLKEVKPNKMTSLLKF